MPVNQGKWTGEFVLSEANGTLSRAQVTVAAAAPAMVPGTLMGIITASGFYAPYSNANVDGTQTCVGALYRYVGDSASNQQAVVITRLAEFQRSELTGWDAAAEVELNARFIVTR
jgi:hypothetical protein